MNAVGRTMLFSHILAWVDGSDEACRAAEQAARMATALGAGLSFLAIGKAAGPDEGYDRYAEIEGVTDPMPPSVDTEVRACLDQAMSIAAKVGLEDAAGLVRTGDPVTAICHAARERGADLVVVRRHRSGLVERLLGGSVPDTLATGCGFAVLSVG